MAGRRLERDWIGCEIGILCVFSQDVVNLLSPLSRQGIRQYSVFPSEWAWILDLSSRTIPQLDPFGLQPLDMPVPMAFAGTFRAPLIRSWNYHLGPR